jgi:hypothetical protein
LHLIFGCVKWFRSNWFGSKTEKKKGVVPKERKEAILSKGI